MLTIIGIIAGILIIAAAAKWLIDTIEDGELDADYDNKHDEGDVK